VEDKVCLTTNDVKKIAYRYLAQTTFCQKVIKQVLYNAYSGIQQFRNRFMA